MAQRRFPELCFGGNCIIMIKAIIFDFFGVIGVSTYQMIVDDIEISTELQTELTDLHRAFDHGFMSEPEFMKNYASLLSLDQYEFEKRYYKAQSRFHTSEKLLNYIKVLRTEYKIGLLSNVGEESYLEFIKPIENNFDKVVTSFSVELAKPDTAIFEYTANELGVLTSECLMVDDTENNCRGAITAGMQAIRYINFEDFSEQIKIYLPKA